MNDRANGNVLRRRRSWYRRRLRTQRTLGMSILVAVIAAFCWQNASRFFSLPSFHASQVLPDSFTTRANRRMLDDLAATPQHGTKRTRYVTRIPGVYPYSLIPGGVKNPAALQEVTAQDHALSRHYAQFDYSKAHLVRVTEPREVYVSYRIRDTVFWTRKTVRLPVGEMLLTDGKIALRAECGNQISETPQPEVSDQEPEEAVLDQPVAMATFVPPLRPAAPDLPAGAPMASAFSTAGFSFPLVAVGGGPPVGVCRYEDGVVDKHCRPRHKPPRTPEPATMILIASGLSIILWRYQVNRRSLPA